MEVSMLSQKLVIALPLEDSLLEPLHEWGRKFDFTHVESIHFVHVVKKNITPLEFGLVESPDDVTYQDMVPTLQKFLKDEAKMIIPADFKGSIDFLVTKDFNPEEEMVDILKNLNATLLIVATRGKHGFEGLFHSSFTDYMVKFAPCDVFVVRPAPEAEKLKRAA
jgi:nucleotide-binding universal stress UspA family protein